MLKNTQRKIARHKTFLTRLLIILFTVLSPASFAKSEYFGLLDVRFISNNLQEGGLDRSWLDGGVGPFSTQNEQLSLGQALMFGRLEINPQHKINAQVNVYNDPGDTVGIAELYYQFSSEDDVFSVKAGSFFPEISMENTGPGWTSQIPLTNSAINTWIGEEVRIIGLQASVKKSFSPEWKWGFSASAFKNNDPVGAMLTWRGWTMHDRQLRFGEKIAIVDLPMVAGDSGFIFQAPYYEPFVEVDGNVGYAVSTSLTQQRGLKIKWYHYDNRANPKSLKAGQYGWETTFDHVGLSYSLPSKIKITSQWMEGSTLMGDSQDIFVNADFDAWYLGVAKQINRLHVSARYDSFNVIDLDNTPGDSNDQSGDAWTLGLRYDVNSSVAVLMDYVRVEQNKMARVYFSVPADVIYRQSQLALQWRF